MLKYLQHAEIDFTLWDACVRNSEQAIIYAYSGYLEISAQGSWDALVEMQAGAYVSVFPLPFKKRLGIYFTYQPLHSQQLGLFTTSQSQETAVEKYLHAIPKHFQKVYLQLNTNNSILTGALPADFSSVPRITYHLNLSESYQILKSHYNSNLKRNLKKAQKENYGITPSENLPALIKLYRQTRGKDLKEVKDRHYNLFEKQYAYLQEKELGYQVQICEKEELIAGAVFLKQPGKLIFIFSAASATARKHGAMAQILDQFIKQYAGTQTVLDFEGSSIPNLARFYSSFGAKPVTYLSVTRNNLPWYLRWFIK